MEVNSGVYLPPLWEITAEYYLHLRDVNQVDTKGRCFGFFGFCHRFVNFHYSLHSFALVSVLNNKLDLAFVANDGFYISWDLNKDRGNTSKHKMLFREAKSTT